MGVVVELYPNKMPQRRQVAVRLEAAAPWADNLRGIGGLVGLALWGAGVIWLAVAAAAAMLPPG